MESGNETPRGGIKQETEQKARNQTVLDCDWGTGLRKNGQECALLRVAPGRALSRQPRLHEEARLLPPSCRCAANGLTTSVGGQLPALLPQAVLEGRQHELHVGGLGVVAHEAHAPAVGGRNGRGRSASAIRVHAPGGSVQGRRLGVAARNQLTSRPRCQCKRAQPDHRQQPAPPLPHSPATTCTPRTRSCQQWGPGRPQSPH